DRRDVRPGAGQPGLAGLHEVERVTIDDRTAVQRVGPDVDESARFGSGRRRLPNPDLADVREGDAGAGPGQDTLGRRDDVLVDRRRVGGLPRPAAEGPAAVRKRSAYAVAFARRRRERDRVAHEPGE